MLADMLRDLTVRTTLVAAPYRSRRNARESCADHARIVDVLAAGDLERAESLMLAHIGTVEVALGPSIAGQADARERLRATLAPLAAAGAVARSRS